MRWLEGAAFVAVLHIFTHEAPIALYALCVWLGWW